jgi:signal peptidase
VIADIPPWFRAARVPDDGSYSLFRTDRVTVRTNVGEQWSTGSDEGVAVGGVLFGFGRPFCR